MAYMDMHGNLIKEVLQIVKELADFGCALHGAVQLPQQIFLLLGQVGGRFHHHGEAVVAPAPGIVHLGDALIPEDKLLAGLGSLGDFKAHLAVQGSSLLLAIDCGVQFLTRSHRTALTEQTNPVPRAITRSFLGKASYTVLIY